MKAINTSILQNNDRTIHDESAFEDAIKIAIGKLNTAAIFFEESNEQPGKDRVNRAKDVLDTIGILTGRDIRVEWEKYDRTSYRLVENQNTADENTLYAFTASENGVSKKFFIPAIPSCFNKKLRDMGCIWDSDVKQWYHQDRYVAKHAIQLIEQSHRKDGDYANETNGTSHEI